MANDTSCGDDETRRSEEKYRTLFDSIDEGFCLVEVLFDAGDRAVDLRVLEVNPSFEKQTGIPNMRGKRVREIIPRLEDHWFETYGRVALTGESARFESEAAPMNRWFDVYAFRFGEPEQRKVAVVFNEITGRKQAQEALRVSEERFRSYFELGLIGMAITSPAKGCLEVNNELCRILGYERSELLQMTWVEITHPDDLAADVAQFTRVMAGEIDGYTLDKRWICKQGRVIDSLMAAKCLRRVDGSVDYFVGLVLDTTERRRGEAALRRSEATLAEGQRLSHTGSWTWNVSTGEVGWSAELYRIYGLDPETTKPGYPDMLSYVHPADRGRVQKTFEEAVHAEREYESAYRVVWPGGTIRHVSNLAHPVFNEAGALVEYVGTTIDTTQRVQAEEAMQKLQAELAHVTRVTAMGELAASIAHEINQPLGAIVNNSNVLLGLVDAATGLPDELREILLDIVQDANRTSAIVARIRAMTRRTLPEKTSLQLHDVIADVLALAHCQLAERHIQVVREVPEDLPRVSGDRVQLQQVLLNLVMNSIEAMGDVEEARRVLTIGGERDELDGQPAVRLTVRDFGSGFRPEDCERLFDAFYTTKPQGMGMGLRIGRSIVEAHGGRLWATPNAGPGMTFSCALPTQIRTRHD